MRYNFFIYIFQSRIFFFASSIYTSYVCIFCDVAFSIIGIKKQHTSDLSTHSSKVNLSQNFRCADFVLRNCILNIHIFLQQREFSYKILKYFNYTFTNILYLFFYCLLFINVEYQVHKRRMNSTGV